MAVSVCFAAIPASDFRAKRYDLFAYFLLFQTTSLVSAPCSFRNSFLFCWLCCLFSSETYITKIIWKDIFFITLSDWFHNFWFSTNIVSRKKYFWLKKYSLPSSFHGNIKEKNSKRKVVRTWLFRSDHIT